MLSTGQIDSSPPPFPFMDGAATESARKRRLEAAAVAASSGQPAVKKLKQRPDGSPDSSDDSRKTTSTLTTTVSVATTAASATSPLMIIESSKSAQERYELECAVAASIEDMMAQPEQEDEEEIEMADATEPLFAPSSSDAAVMLQPEPPPSPSSHASPEPPEVAVVPPAAPPIPVRPRRVLVARDSPPPEPPELYWLTVPIFSARTGWEKRLEKRTAKLRRIRQKTPDLDHHSGLEQCMLAWWERGDTDLSDDEADARATAKRATVARNSASRSTTSATNGTITTAAPAGIMLSPRKAVTKLKKNAYVERVSATVEERTPEPAIDAAVDVQTWTDQRWTTVADYRASFNPPDPPTELRRSADREAWIEAHESVWALTRRLPDRAQDGGPILTTGRPSAPVPARPSRDWAFLGDPIVWDDDHLALTRYLPPRDPV